MSAAAVLYVPVVHQGYRRFLEACGPIDSVLVLGRSVTGDRRPFQKDLRAVDPQDAASMLRVWSGANVSVVEAGDLSRIGERFSRVVMPDEDVCRDLASQLRGQGVSVELVPFFLRWESRNVDANLDVACEKIAPTPALVAAMATARQAAAGAHDQYRQIGAAMYSEEGEGPILCAANAVPGGWEIYYVEGDPRSQFKKGSRIDASLSLHAESAIVAEAARLGIRTEGLSLYVTTFPCPTCAKLVAASRFGRVLFSEGYAMLDGESVLRSAGIQIAQVVELEP